MSASRSHPPGVRTASQLVARGEVTCPQVYAATLVLARLHDRGVGFALTLENMCQVLGYIDAIRPPASHRWRQARRAGSARSA